MRRALALPLLVLLGAGAALPARAQTMLDQQQRLIDIHNLLLDLPPAGAPGALRDRELGLGLEIIGIPEIDGTTGTKKQITASDRTRVFPRPRVAIGLPAPEGFRTFAGLSYIPPFQINEVSTNYIAGEAGIAWVPSALSLGLRGHALYAMSKSPVTDPNTRDTLKTSEAGADLSAGWRFAFRAGGIGDVSVTPYAGAGVVWADGHFRVTSDGVVLTSSYTGAALNAGVRLLVHDRWEAVGEVDAYPGRLVHPVFRVGYVLDLAAR